MNLLPDNIEVEQHPLLKTIIDSYPEEFRTKVISSSLDVYEDVISIKVSFRGIDHIYSNYEHSDFYSISSFKGINDSSDLSHITVTYNDIEIDHVEEFKNKILNLHKSLNGIKKYNL